MTTPNVAVVGSYNVGLTMMVPRFPVPGETVIGRHFSEGPGGKGSNQAIAAARLGAEAAFVGNIGTDQYGDAALDLWETESVDASYVNRDETAHTGVGFVLVDEAGENEITVAPGANHTLDDTHVRDAADGIRESACVLGQLEVTDEPLLAVGNLATEAGMPFILNPAPARELPRQLLEHVTYLTPNENEARILAGRDPDADLPDETVAEALLGLGVETVVMTRGADGALIVTPQDRHSVDAPSVDVIDTTGAGDAFNGALAVSLAEGHDLADAVEFACCAGALAVTELEVIPGLPTREELEAFWSGSST